MSEEISDICLDLLHLYLDRACRGVVTTMAEMSPFVARTQVHG